MASAAKARARRNNRRARLILQRSPEAIRKGVQDELLGGAQAVQFDYARLVRKRSGELARTILDRQTIGVRSGGLKVIVSPTRTKRLRRQAGWRAHFLERGTSRSPAFPAFKPAVDMNYRKNRQAIEHAYVKALDQLVKRTKRGGYGRV